MTRLAAGLAEPGEVAEAGDDLVEPFQAVPGAVEDAAEVVERVAEVHRVRPWIDVSSTGKTAMWDPS
jgi:hypothetical protein